MGKQQLENLKMNPKPTADRHQRVQMREFNKGEL